ncbi:MAG TPA: TspO/MBR family protein [Microvirga sp.]
MLHGVNANPTGARRPAWQRALLAVLPVVAASLLGGLVTAPRIPTWYADLAKPAFTPPNGVFAPVWTILFAMMAYAAWRILSLPRDKPGRGPALVVHHAQLVLNVLWSFAFFGARSPGLGLLVIAGLLVGIVATIRLFWALDRIAAALLLPYLAWVAYATALNVAIWRLNP